MPQPRSLHLYFVQAEWYAGAFREKEALLSCGTYGATINTDCVKKTEKMLINAESRHHEATNKYWY